ncbi:MAG: SUF system Fe-S cluster assembly regulator [Pseudomonadota bacterium]
MSKMTDYGTVVLATLANQPGAVFSAVEVAEATRLNEPTVKKILKTLARANLVDSFRGQQGGYALKGSAHEISAARIIDALEGPVMLTQCSAPEYTCHIQSCCTVGRSWQIINHQIRMALEDISLAQLLQGGPLAMNPMQFDLPLPASAN